MVATLTAPARARRAAGARRFRHRPFQPQHPALVPVLRHQDRPLLHQRSSCEDERSRGLIKAILQVCRVLNLDCVAEGVETPEQLALLQKLGCPHAQGYLIGRPEPPATIRRALWRAAGKPGQGSALDPAPACRAPSRKGPRGPWHPLRDDRRGSRCTRLRFHLRLSRCWVPRAPRAKARGTLGPAPGGHCPVAPNGALRAGRVQGRGCRIFPDIGFSLDRFSHCEAPADARAVRHPPRAPHSPAGGLRRNSGAAAPAGSADTLSRLARCAVAGGSQRRGQPEPPHALGCAAGLCAVA